MFTRKTDFTFKHSNVSGKVLTGDPTTNKANFDSQAKELRDYVNNTLLPEMESTTSGNSGADKIGTSSIAGLVGNTVQTLLGALKSLFDGHKTSATLDHPDNSVTTNKIAAGAVTNEKIADFAVSNIKIADDAVTATQIKKISLIDGIFTGTSYRINEFFITASYLIKLITGKANWYDAPSKSIENLINDDVSHKTANILDHPDDSVTDDKIFKHYPPTLPIMSNGEIAGLFSSGSYSDIMKVVAYVIKRIKGDTGDQELLSWFANPPTSLKDLDGRIDVLETKTNGVDSKVNNIVSSSGTSNTEIVDARFSTVNSTSYPTLSNRLDSVDTQLADIVSIANYPVIAPETDDTARVLRAIAAGTKVIKFDAQTYTVNLEMTRGNVIFQGAGMGKTIIKGATANTPVIKTKGYKYITFLDMDVRSPYDNNTCVIDCTDSRYLDFRNLNINQIDGGSGNYNYSSDGILFADSSDTWTGYNRISNIFVTRCKNGIKSTSAANTVLSIKDSTFSYCGYFGLDLANLSTFYGYNNDISSNGQLMPVGGENYTQYGGVKITTSYNVKFQNTYCENNPNCYTGIYSHNNFYVDSSSTMIDINGVRDMVGTYGSIYPPFMSNKACSITYMPQDDRLGSKKVRNLAVNGNFKYFLSDGTFPQVWNATSKTSATYTQETTDLPSGFETGLKIAQVTDAAITGSYVTIYDSGNLSKGIISDISKYAGQYLTLACWVKTTLANNLRIGFDTNTSGTGVYFSVGKTLTIPSVGEWSRVVVRYQIVGTESRIMLGFRQSTIGTTSIITGMACSLDYGVNSNEGQFITEDGGNILSQEFKIGGCRHGYGTAAPTSGTWGKGDIIWNTSPSEAGTAGSKYVVNGWICTVAGTPGTWLPMRVLTGN